MSKNFYNRIAPNYDTDWSGIYRDTRAISINQIIKHYNGQTIGCALDLAVGTGNSFYDLSKKMYIVQRIGVDISYEMLKYAKSKIGEPISLICEDARNIQHHIPDSSQDLILCHYLFSYLDIHEILELAFRLLKPGGVLSVATTTKKNLKELSTGRFRGTGKLFRVAKHLSQVETPKNHCDCMKILAEHKFDILNEYQFDKHVKFTSFEDVTAWAVDSGWAAQYFDSGFKVKTLLGKFIFASAAIFMHPLYPITAHSDISIALARKPVKDVQSMNEANC